MAGFIYGFEDDSMRTKLRFSLSIFAFIAYAGAARADESNPALMTPAISPTAPTATLPDSDEEFGLRAGYGTADVEKKLFATTAHGGQLNSRLRHDDMASPSGEFFGRVDLHGGSFVKGVLGVGTLSGGHLNDEDFPPANTPYSSTFSSQRNGFADYGMLDFGLDAWRAPRTRVGVFLGASWLARRRTPSAARRSRPTMSGVRQGLSPPIRCRLRKTRTGPRRASA
jgi:hypothetical protein